MGDDLLEELLALRGELAADLAAMERLYELSVRLMSASERGPLLAEILAAAMEIQHADFGIIQLRDTRSGAIEIVAQHGFDEQTLADFVRLDTGGSARARAMAAGTRVTIEDVERDDAYAPLLPIAARSGFRAVDATPLFGRGGDVIGALATYFRAPHRPSEREMRLTDLYARQACEMIERSRDEERLAYQAGLLDLATEAIIASDADSRITYWNAGAEAVYGWTADEALGRAVDELFPPVDDDWERSRDARLRDLRAGQVIHGEYRRRRKDGAVIWIGYSARALFDRTGAVNGYISVHRDITERKRVDAQLAYQAHLLDMATEAIIAFDAEGRITYWNPGAVRAYGWSAEEVIGASFRDVLHRVGDPVWEEGRPERLAAVNRGETVQSEFLGTRKDGTPVWIEYSTRAFFNPDGNVAGYVAVHRDITERKRIEQQLARQAFLLANVSDAVIEFEPDSMITYWSPSAERVYGWTAEEALGQRSVDLLRSRYVATPRTDLLRSVAEHGYAEVEIRQTTKDGREIDVEAHVTLMRGPRGEPATFLTVNRDVTERRRAAERLAEQAYLLANVSDAVVRYDIDSTITYWSPSAERLYGYTAEEALGRRSLDLLQTVYRHPDDTRERVLAELTERGQHQIELEQTTKDGRVIEVESRMTLLRDERGAPLGVLGINRDVTERNRAARQLERQAFLLANVSDAVVGLDFDFRITYWSPSAERVYGWSAEEALGRRSLDLLQSINLTMPHQEALELVLATGEVRFEVAHWTKDGRRLEIESRVTLMRDERGDRSGMLAIHRDITERKRAEAALRASEERLRRALQIETVGVVFFRPDGRITWTNDAFLRMTGYTREETERAQLRWDELTPLEWMPRTVRAIQEFLATGRSTPYEKEYLRKDGSRWWALFATTRLSDDDDEGVKFIVDINEAKRAEALLRASEERFRTVANLVPDLLWSGDAEGRTTWYNRRWFDYTGIALTGAPRDDWLQVIHPDDREAALREFRAAIAAGRPIRQEHRIRRADGEYRWFLIETVPVRDERGAIVQWLGAATDIQEQRQAMELLEARVAEATKELRALSRRLLTVQEEERRHLARELHDEVGQALTGLSLSLATARHGGRDHLDHAVAITDELLERVRQMSLDLRPSILDDLGLLPALLSLIERFTLRTGVQVDMRHRGLDRRFPAEVETAAYRVVQEALTNIARHSGAGRATVWVVADDWLTVHVADRGRGFDVDDCLRAGRSSGLSGMRERVALLGGSISIESAPDDGTTVVAELPLHGPRDDGGTERGA